MFRIFGLYELFSNIEDFSVTGKGKKKKASHHKKPNIKILNDKPSKSEEENTNNSTDNNSYDTYEGDNRHRRGRRGRRHGRGRRFKNINYFYNYPEVWLPLKYPIYYDDYYPYDLYPPDEYSSQTYPSYEYPYVDSIERPLQIEPLQNAKSEKNYQQSYFMIMFFLLCVLLFILVIIIVFKK